MTDLDADVPEVHWIKDDRELAQACSEWCKEPFLGIDTEFVRTRTFFAQLGLIQLGHDGAAYLIDPLAITSMQPLWALFEDGSVTKVLHSGSEDLEIFVRLAGGAPRPLFDTQVAAALCGLGPSLSYQALVREVCGVEVSKSETRSDWLKRPLSESQIRYAALDVKHLETIRESLWDRLGELDRRHWMTEEMDRICDRAESIDTANDQFHRFKFASKLDALGVETLWRLVEWRERTARIRDLPRNFVIEPDPMLDIARHRPESLQALHQCAKLGRTARKYHSEELLELVTAALNTSKAERKQPPPRPLDPTSRPLMKRLKERVQGIADELRLAPELLCSKKDLTQLIRQGSLPSRLQGWRQPLLGKDLLALCKAES